MFEWLDSLITRGEVLVIAFFGLATAVLAAITFVKTRSFIGSIGVVLAGIAIVALLNNSDLFQRRIERDYRQTGAPAEVQVVSSVQAVASDTTG